MNGNGNGTIQSWYDFAHIMPKNPLDLITDAELASTTGEYKDSSNFSDPPGSWSTNTVTYNSAPACVALGTDSQQKVEDAAMWNFRHLTMTDNTAIVPALEKLIFLRAGREWKMNIELAMGGTTYTDVELSFRNNAATRGDKQGTIPVISFTGSFTGNQTLAVTLLQTGNFIMGLRLIDGSSNWYFFEMEWSIVS